mmetsp:Transcript_50819/g.84234  ORF Transcript_50819/g.84234 Transcript_50819/m.84234 type:complete len:390 (+) Transcript_50819:232-1401(+)
MHMTRALVCITCFADPAKPKKTITLRQAVTALLDWRIAVEIIVITQNNSLLQPMLGELNNTVRVIEQPKARCAFGSSGSMAMTPLCLPWVHRRVMEAALQRKQGRPDVFAYLEDDIELTWAAIQLWASDTVLLRQSSNGLLTRSFYLYRKCDGDQEGSGLAVASPQPSKPRERVAGGHAGQPCMVNGGTFPGGGFASWKCTFSAASRHFVGLPSPYVASWVMDVHDMMNFQKSAQWNLRGLHGTMRFWGVQEAAAFGDGFRNLTLLSQKSNLRDCMGHKVVPFYYSRHGPQLDPSAGIRHLEVPTQERAMSQLDRKRVSLPVQDFFKTDSGLRHIHVHEDHVRTLSGGIAFSRLVKANLPIDARNDHKNYSTSTVGVGPAPPKSVRRVG